MYCLIYPVKNAIIQRDKKAAFMVIVKHAMVKTGRMKYVDVSH